MLTRTAGSALLRATLSWPHLSALPEEPEPLASASRKVTVDGEGVVLRLEHETTAQTRRALGAALDDHLRATAAYAARTDALLEVAVARRHEPQVASRPALEGLAGCLSRAGFRVRFAPSPRPAPPADAWVGIGGTGGDRIEDLLLSRPLWNTR